MVYTGDILYALYGATSGEVGIAQLQGAINQAILAIKPDDGYDSQFIMQWLRGQKQKIVDKYLQGGQGNLSGALVKNLLVKFPIYKEQQQIGIFFGNLDNLITLHQRKLKHLQEQKIGLLQKMFPKEGANVPEVRFPEFTDPWEQRKLGELLDFSNGFNGGQELYGRGIRFISVMDILNNKFITYDVILGSVNLDPTNKSNERFLVRYGDIVFQRSSENVEDAGKSNVYMDKEKPAAFGGFVIRGKKIAVYEPIFMKYVLDGQFVRNQIMSVAQGAQHINVGQEALRNILVNLPKADEQKSIGSFFLEIDNLITLHQRKLEHLQEQKKALLQQMFI